MRLAKVHRRWLRTPGLFAAVVCCLGIGLGVSTAIFAVVDHILLRPLPYPNSERLVLLDRVSSQGFGIPVALADFEHWESNLRSAESLAAVKRWYQMPLVVGGQGFRAQGAVVSESFFRLLGCPAAQGSVSGESGSRSFRAVVSHAFWDRRLSRTPIAQTALEFKGRSVQVAAVLADGCQAPEALLHPRTEVFLIPPRGQAPDGLEVGYTQLARMKEGFTPEIVAGELAEKPRPLPTGTDYPGWRWRVAPLLTVTIGESVGAANVLLAAIGLMLVATIASMSGYFLLRTTRRRGELAIRRALGARLAALAGIPLSDALYAALWGSGLAIGIALLLVEGVKRTIPDSVPRAAQIGVDLRVLAFGVAASLSVAVIASLLPVVQARRTPIRTLVQASGSSARQSGPGFGAALQKLIASLQVAAAFVLLAGSVLLLRNFMDLTRIDLGFRPHDVHAMFVLKQDGQDALFQKAVVDDLLEALRSRAGVESAALVNMLPLGSVHGTSGIRMAGTPGFNVDELLTVSEITISDDYFRTAGISLLRGRDFKSKGNDASDCIINHSLATRIWGTLDAVGKTLPIIQCNVIGVVRNVTRADIREGPANEIYHHFEGRGLYSFAEIIVRSSDSPSTVVAGMTDSVVSIMPGLGSNPPRPWLEDVSRQTQKERFYTWVVGVFSLSALLLATAALVTVVSQSVREARREIGIRMALGATSRIAALPILKPVFWFCGLGLVLGVSIYYGTARAMESMLFRLSPTDPGVVAAAAAVVIAVCLAGCWFPARAAAHVDPAQTLRGD